jgi:7-cyano-7-deazaguanine synthase
MSSKALVLFSGGQDSTVCLAWALERYETVETIGFDYRQRHIVELEVRETLLKEISSAFPTWKQRLGQDHHIDLGVLGEISETSLTRHTEFVFAEGKLPNTFVPGRNLVFFTMAAAVAYRRGIKYLVGGMCETDYSGYPDCREETLKSQQATLSLGMGQDFVIETPLMWLSKAQTWELAGKLGGNKLVDMIREYTHSCYLGERDKKHDWGYGCGTCLACELRAKGWREFL